MTDQEREDLKKQVENALTVIRPYLNEDGGDVELVDIDDDKVVKVKLVGACYNCPMSIQTLKLGVEQIVKRYVPEVVEVIEVKY
ncbi:MAG: NifU family protein [Thiomargarita sp.]|nr:NifU family protein [Thiomargarita sp.]